MILRRVKSISIITLLFLLTFNPSVDAARRFPHPDEILFKPLHFAPPRAERIVLENGIIVHFLEDRELPLLNVAVFIKAGSLVDPDGKEGIAELTATVMRNGGTTALSGDTIDEILEHLAIDLTVSVNKRYSAFYLNCLTEHFDQALEVLFQILTAPAFEETKFNRAKELKIEELRRTADDPVRFAFREFSRLFYGDNPWGKSPRISTVENINRNDLLQFHRLYFHPSNIMIAISGDISKEHMTIIMNKRFSQWKSTTSDFRDPGFSPPSSRSGVFFLQREIPQAIIIAGQHSPPWNHPDSFAFSIIDFIMGSGSFRSRIPHTIRNEMGVAYSAGSFYKRRHDHGLFAMYAIVGAESAVQALKSMENIIHDCKSGSIRVKDIEWGKKSLTNSFIFSFTSSHYITQQQLLIELEKLPDDYLDTYPKKIASISESDVQRVIGTYVLPLEHSIILIMGSSVVRSHILTLFKEVHSIEGKL